MFSDGIFVSEKCKAQTENGWSLLDKTNNVSTMKTMNFLRKAVACALLLCAGLQQMVADDQLTKEDSVALEKLYHDYYSAMYKATYNTILQADELRPSADDYEQKKEEIDLMDN